MLERYRRQITGWHSTDTIVPRRDQLRVGIVTLQPVIFGSASQGLQYTAGEPSQCQESSTDDEAAFSDLKNHRAPPPAAEGIVASEAASIIVPTVPSWIAEGSQYSIRIDVAYSEGCDTEYPRNCEHYLAQLTARPAFPRAKEYEYFPMPDMLMLR
jgi:hypothetical protein